MTLRQSRMIRTWQYWWGSGGTGRVSSCCTRPRCSRSRRSRPSRRCCTHWNTKTKSRLRDNLVTVLFYCPVLVLVTVLFLFCSVSFQILFQSSLFPVFFPLVIITWTYSFQVLYNSVLFIFFLFLSCYFSSNVLPVLKFPIYIMFLFLFRSSSSPVLILIQQHSRPISRTIRLLKHF